MYEVANTWIDNHASKQENFVAKTIKCIQALSILKELKKLYEFQLDEVKCVPIALWTRNFLIFHFNEPQYKDV
ncbi:hypothetical protein ACJX0J_020190, partial [Zea mays]